VEKDDALRVENDAELIDQEGARHATNLLLGQTLRTHQLGLHQAVLTELTHQWSHG